MIMGDSWVKTYLDELEARPLYVQRRSPLTCQLSSLQMEFMNFTNFLSKTPSVSVLLHQDLVEPGQTSTRRTRNSEPSVPSIPSLSIVT